MDVSTVFTPRRLMLRSELSTYRAVERNGFTLQP